MLKLIWILTIFFNQLVWAQDLSRDLEFIETINTQSSPINFPIYFDLDGSMSLITNNLSASVSIGPLGHVGWHRSASHYIRPIRSDEFSFSETKEDLGWIEVKRLRWELGLGIETFFASKVLSLGFVPFKGARQVMIRQKKSLQEVSPSPKLPDELGEINSWNTGDRGSFQRYGGIQLFAGLNVVVGTPLSYGVTIQNLFNIVVSKISDTKIQVTISEEHLSKRRIQTGLAVANLKFQAFHGKRLSASFQLSLNDPYHHQLYQLALHGKLHILQSKLPQGSQKMDWKGSERMGYLGIPGVMAKNYQRSEYEMTSEGEEDVIDIKSISNSGLLLPVRNYNKIVYQTSTDLVLFWYSEINRTSERLLNKTFLFPGKVMGAKGFDSLIPDGSNIGSSLLQMGLVFTRREIEAIDQNLLNELLVHFKDRCEKMDLSCAKEKKFNKISKLMKSWLGQKWEDVRDNLGFLLMEEPALINSYVKTIKSKKNIYFKFLNKKFQSLEGLAPIEVN